MALTTQEVNECAAEFIEFAQSLNVVVSEHGTQNVRANVVSINNWLISVQAAFNNSLIGGFKTLATLKMKAILLCIVARKMAKV